MDAEQEQAAVDDVVRRLTEKFSGVSPARVSMVVQAAYKDLSDKPLRDYIPVLVEHASKTTLRAERNRKTSD
ncbi:three-helix bundle dimerization domain-containing protein [Subtercola sp. RTI3]|uniref:three-helix bundle dimerization domain-containing protein n=1 Tax=Subtercola sp. RTI3 TaxID=3048639 RepID=UPI002B226BF5|nr:hypothetical protein [Subtercola sp. RTI3]MEA9986795.1 hypothetical protein [Subtercola sp. RTI3]